MLWEWWQGRAYWCEVLVLVIQYSRWGAKWETDGHAWMRSLSLSTSSSRLARLGYEYYLTENAISLENVCILHRALLLMWLADGPWWQPENAPVDGRLVVDPEFQKWVSVTIDEAALFVCCRQILSQIWEIRSFDFRPPKSTPNLCCDHDHHAFHLHLHCALRIPSYSWPPSRW